MAKASRGSRLTPRALARELRHLPDRLLHPLRRRRALARVRADAPASVLMVCHGNICRSPYAAAVLRRASEDTGSGVAVDSAGFIGPGRQPPSNARAIAKEHGFDLETHISKVITPDLIAAADLIIVMDLRQRRAIEDRFEPPAGSVLLLGDLDPSSIRRRTVRDPIDRSEDVFRSVYSRVDRCVGALVENLVAIRGAEAEPSGAAGDPHGSS